ncbi:nitrilase-related carbon-nitrogen hydrolase [Marinifilum caeruleilacunae]|uniref:Carbon-nitrogen hydrolase n=1 Tax=Marinifilum caeruleilacunae TaxID=2499076 RepID=A0ABX1WXY8_9BACT|nr:nitrilase-related carbon-nitrogen hydrolase [Marinifilum caeruleilacunae]NOU61008.1 carbon-nitrogen hydrolase [Marinifilum caeruleilacunae]
MKLALVQFAPVFGDLQSSMQKLELLLQKAKDADLIVLPEMANTGYNFDSKKQAYALSEPAQNSLFVEFLINQCKRYNFALVTGFAEKEGEKLYNSALLIDESGVVSTYRKLHLFMNEKNIFEAGDIDLEVIDYKGTKLGMLVCFDWMFPEAWRKLALQGAELILHPSNLVLPYAQSVIPSYALVNRMYIATANRVGSEKDLTFTGQSVIAGCKGEILAKAGVETEEVLMVDIDPSLALNKMITPLNDAFEDRRTDKYE